MSTTVTTTAKRFSLISNDFIKGLTVSVLSAVLALITVSIQAGNLNFDWKAIGLTALTTGIAYLTKNFFDKPKIVVTGATDETIKAVKEGEADVKVDGVIAKVKTP